MRVALERVTPRDPAPGGPREHRRAIDLDEIRSVRVAAVQVRHSAEGGAVGASAAAEYEFHLRSGETVRLERRAASGEAFVEVAPYQIKIGGRLYKDDKLLVSVRDEGVQVSAGPYRLHADRPPAGLVRIGGNDQRFVHLDGRGRRLLVIVKRHLHVGFAEPAPGAKPTDTRRAAFAALLRLGDGVPNPELGRWNAMAALDRALALEGAAAGIARPDAAALDALAKRLAAGGGARRRQNEQVALALLHLAAADGTVRPPEIAALTRLCASLGLGTAATATLFARVRLVPAAETKPRDETRPRPAAVDPAAAIYLGLLGLGRGASLEEVKRAYRRVAREHHPDILAGRGASQETMTRSEDVLKAVNEAYAYLLRAGKRRTVRPAPRSRRR